MPRRTCIQRLSVLRLTDENYLFLIQREMGLNVAAVVTIMRMQYSIILSMHFLHEE